MMMSSVIPLGFCEQRFRIRSSKSTGWTGMCSKSWAWPSKEVASGSEPEGGGSGGSCLIATAAASWATAMTDFDGERQDNL